MDNNVKPVVYCIFIKRVSSTKQGLQGDSFDQQKDRMNAFIETLGLQLNAQVKVLREFEFAESASGDISLQPILKVIDFVQETNKSGAKISYAILKSTDRITRAGAYVYDYIKKEFAKYGVRLIDTYGVISTQTINTLAHLGVEYDWSVSSPSHITEILEAERAKRDVGDILTRLIGAEISYVRAGYRVRPAPPGYRNSKVDTPHGKRTILEPHPEESPWYIKMFELRAQGSLTDLQIVDEINSMGYHSRVQMHRDPTDRTKVIGHRGNKELKAKQMQRYITNPIYAGVNAEKWTKDKPVKCHFPGLVSIELWNEANRGKITIVETEQGISILKGKPKPWLLRKNKNNPLYPYKEYVRCPVCSKKLFGSASKGKAGKYYPAYHCGRGHKLFRIPLETFNKIVESFCRQVHFSREYRRKFRDIVLEEWHKREKTLSGDQVELHQLVANCVGEIQAIKESIKKSRSESVIRMFENDIEELEQKKVNAEVTLCRKESEKLKIEVFINETQYYMEHLHELLLDQANPLKSAAMFGLLFDTVPTYDNLIDGTPHLAPIFALNEAFERSKGQSVSPDGFEPSTYSLKGSHSTAELWAHFAAKWAHKVLV